MTDPADRKIEIPSDTARGRSDYAAYPALWHLADIGVVSDMQSFASQGWDLAAQRARTGARPTRVALIDTSVAAGHPNLQDAVDTDLAIDFFSSRLGVPSARGVLRAQIAETAPIEMPEDLPSGAKALWSELVAHVKEPSTTDHKSPVRAAISPDFSAHGTAMAGLIGARPLGAEQTAVAPVQVLDLASGSLSEFAPVSSVAFAYAGVDPFCQIVPISTNFDPEPEQLILALLYTLMIGADITVLARDFPTPGSLAAGTANDKNALSRALGVDLSAHELDQWQLLEDLVISVSLRVPVVCAAGNGAQDRILFPGSLAHADNGIIAVGARTAAGQPASYSPPSEAISIYAPSGDGERLDRDMQRLDTQSAGFNSNHHSGSYTASLSTWGDPATQGHSDIGTHAAQDLVSTDVPGRAGYNASPNAQVFGRDGAILDYRSAYCRFSGTSGATALTAGMLSLAISSGRLIPGGEKFGIKAKAALCAGGTQNYEKAEPALRWSTFAPSAAEDM